MSVNRQYPQRKRTRLPAAAYADTSSICSLTIVSAARSLAFADDEFTLACLELLTSEASTHGVTLHAYCYMPDHLHLLISPSPTVSVIEFVRRFKGLSTRLAWVRGRDGPLWQSGFYDHFLRRDEDLRRAIEYILNNPVRAGIVSETTAYPYSGWRVQED